MVWSLTAPGKLCFRSWEDEDLTVVYNTASGDTHLIESPGIEILQLLQTSPHTVEGLTGALQANMPESEPFDITPYVTHTLHQLMLIGLVRETLL